MIDSQICLLVMIQGIDFSNLYYPSTLL